MNVDHAEVKRRAAEYQQLVKKHPKRVALIAKHKAKQLATTARTTAATLRTSTQPPAKPATSEGKAAMEAIKQWKASPKLRERWGRIGTWLSGKPSSATAQAPEPIKAATLDEVLAEAAALHDSTPRLQTEFGRGEEGKARYVAYVKAVHQGDISPDQAVLDTEAAVKRGTPRFVGLSLEAVLEAAGKEFDRSASLNREFAACQNPKETWLSFVRGEFRKQRERT
jgi:hypothetical protein